MRDDPDEMEEETLIVSLDGVCDPDDPTISTLPDGTIIVSHDDDE